MAINRNNALPLRHICYCGASGSGKTTAVKMLGMVGRCAVIFDPLGDYVPSRIRKLSGLGNGRKVYAYKTRRTFANAFLEAWRSGADFAISFQSPHDNGEALRDDALWFADLVWKASDGKRELHVVFEELARYSTTAGADRTILGAIANAGRSFGLVAHWSFQRPTQIPKTMIDDASEYIVGAQNSMRDVKRWLEELDCDAERIVSLGHKNQPRKKYYLHKKDGIGNIQEISLSF